jgi:hypothetical protein
VHTRRGRRAHRGRGGHGYYHTTDAAEGLADFTATMGAGVTYGVDRHAATNAALNFAAGSLLTTGALAALPSRNAARSVSACGSRRPPPR